MYSNLRINSERLYNHIMALGKIGETPEGGVRRVAFTAEDLRGRELIVSLMEKIGLTVTIDAAANIIGTLPGQKPHLPSILIGSHIDTVPNGGKYDGSVGVLGGIECLEVLIENNIAPFHSVQLVVFPNEEGGLTGSRGLTGQLKTDALDIITQSGKTVREGIRALGGDPEQLQNAVRKRGEIKAFIELHNEQGAVLTSKNLQVGIVEGIVGTNWWDVLIEGKTNHAGTTPMDLRQDALLAAAHLVVEVNQLVKSIPGSQVATVGKINAQPGAYNVIAGSVSLGLDIRDLSEKKIPAIFSQIHEKAREIARNTKTRITFRSVETTLPAPTDPAICNVISEATRQVGLTSLFMPSGAGHDAQNIALIAPIGMIFIPSVGGISHSPKELCLKDDIANGVNVLMHTILKIDSGALDR